MTWLLKKLSDEELISLVKESTSFSNLLSRIGLKGNGCRNTLKERIEHLKIDVSHFTGQGWNKGKTKETHPSVKKQGETFSNRWKGKMPVRSLSIEHREAISRGCNERSQTNGYIKTKWYNVFNPTLNEDVSVQGTWEKAYAEHLNVKGTRWIRNRKVSFQWTKGDNDISHVYYPDFYLPDSDTYVEIKGFMWKSKDGRIDDELKLKLVKEQNPDLRLIVLMKQELRSLGIDI